MNKPPRVPIEHDDEPITEQDASEIGDLGNGLDDTDDGLLATARRAEELLNADDQEH